MQKTISLFIFLFFLSCQSSNEPYVLSDFKLYSGIESGFKINKMIFKNNQSLLNVTLNDTEMNMLKNRFHFTAYDNFIKSYYAPNRIPINLFDFNGLDNNYLFYIKDGNADYEYFIICLSLKKNEMIFCENFRETSPSLF